MLDSVLRKISFRYRLVWTFSVFIILLIGLIAFGMMTYRAIFVRLDETVNTENPVERMLLSATLIVNSSRVDLLLFTSGDPYRMVPLRQDIGEAVQLLKKARSTIPEGDEMVGYDAALETVSGYQTAIEELAQVIRDDPTAFEEPLAAALALGEKAEQEIDGVRNRFAARVTSDDRTVLQQSQGNLSIAGILGLLLLLVTVVILLVVSSSIAHQINEITQTIDGLALGKSKSDLTVWTSEEFGLLSRATNNISAVFSQLRQELIQLMENRKETQSRSTSRLELLAEVARQISAAGNIENMMNHVANMILERLDFYYVGLFLVDKDNNYAILRAATGKAGSFRLQQGYRVKVGEVGLVGSVTNSGEIRLLNDVEVDYVFRRDSLLPDTRSEAVIPMKIDQEVVGVLDIHSDHTHGFNSDDLAMLQTIVDQLAIAIQNARLADELQRSVKEANQLYQRYTQETWSQRVVGQQTSGYQFDLLDVDPIEQDLPIDVIERLRKGGAVAVNSKEIGDVVDDHPVLLVPLMMFNQLGGVVGLENDDQTYQWSEEEISIIEAVTNQVTLAIDNARLLDEAQRRSEQLRILQEVTSVAASNTNFIELLDNVAQIIRARFHLTHCGVLTFDTHQQSATLVVDASVDPFSPGSNILGTRVSLVDNPFIQQLLESRHSILAPDVQENPQAQVFHEMMNLRQTISLMLAPLISRNETIGAILFETADVARRFTNDDLKLLDQISLQISSAIDVARSFEETARRGERQRLIADVTSRIRETLDIRTIMRTAALEARQVLGVPEVTVRITMPEASDEDASLEKL